MNLKLQITNHKSKTAVQFAEDACGFERFAQIVFADAHYNAYLVFLANPHGLGCAAYDRSVFLELAAVCKETVEVVFVLGLNTRLRCQRTLRDAALTSSVAFENNTVNGILAALVLGNAGAAAVGPHFD